MVCRRTINKTSVYKFLLYNFVNTLGIYLDFREGDITMASKPEGLVGDGATAETAYMVRNYDDLKWCCNDMSARPGGDSGAIVYIKLNNDIDGEDREIYDIKFYWEQINVINAIDLDLNQHAIQSFYLKRNAYMITFSTAQYAPAYVHNGRILNIYGDYEGTNRSYGIIELRTLSSAQKDKIIEKISFSMNCDRLSQFVVAKSGENNRCYVRECTFYCTGNCSAGSSLLFNVPNVNECDFYFENFTLNGTSVLGTRNSSQSFPINPTNCRFRGAITLIPSSTTALFQDNRGLFYGTLSNCVIDLDISSDYEGTATANISNNTASYGIYNVDKMFDKIIRPSTMVNMLQCHTSDMDMRVNPQADEDLNAMGFYVIKG